MHIVCIICECVKKCETAYSWECTYVYVLCVTLCIRSMYNIYIRSKLAVGSCFFNIKTLPTVLLVGSGRLRQPKFFTSVSLFCVESGLFKIDCR